MHLFRRKNTQKKNTSTKDELLKIADQILDMMDKEINLEHMKKIYNLSKTFETNDSFASKN